MPGRNARRSIRGRKAGFGRRRGRLRREVRLAARGSDAPKNIGGSDAGVYAPGSNRARFSLSTDEHYVEGQRSTVLESASVASVTLHIIKAKLKTFLPVRENGTDI